MPRLWIAIERKCRIATLGRANSLNYQPAAVIKMSRVGVNMKNDVDMTYRDWKSAGLYMLHLRTGKRSVKSQIIHDLSSNILPREASSKFCFTGVARAALTLGWMAQALGSSRIIRTLHISPPVVSADCLTIDELGISINKAIMNCAQESGIIELFADLKRKGVQKARLYY